MLMDVLSGALTGSGFAGSVRSLYKDFEAPQDVGHLIICLRPDLFLTSVDAFKARMDHLVRAVKSQPRAAGCEEILMPGEPESRSEAALSRTGVPLQKDVEAALREEAQALRVRFPEPKIRE